MNVKCPHCEHRFPPSPKPRCPACGKSVLPAGFYRRRRRRSNTTPVPRPSTPARHPVRPPLASRTLVCTATLLVLALAALPIIVQRSRPAPDLNEAARRQLALDNMTVLRVALNQHHKDGGRYPLTAEGLASLIHNPDHPGWKGPYIFELKPDPWKRRFEYESDGARFRILSAGPDGIPGNDDDISLSGTAP